MAILISGAYNQSNLEPSCNVINNDNTNTYDIDSFETTPQLTQLDTLVNSYDYSLMPVYYDKSTIIGKKPFLNGQVFSLLFLLIGFTISLIVLGIRATLNSENN